MAEAATAAAAAQASQCGRAISTPPITIAAAMIPR